MQIGNFIIGEFFGDVKCRHGHEIRIFNINRGHWAACDTCRTCTFLGSNLMSSWRHESEATWRANAESLEGYKQYD